MSIERLCRVARIEHDQVWLTASPQPCEGCSGCGGRCALFASNDTEVVLRREQFDGSVVVGSMAKLSLEESALRREAVTGYGIPLAGLLLGSVAGWLATAPLIGHADIGTALGAAAGTLLGLRASKHRSKPVCRARVLSSP